MRTILQLMGSFKVTGTENMPLKGGVLLACNHVSLSDPVMMLAALPRPVHYMAAKELFDIPLFGAMIRFMQAFPVKRGQMDMRALAHCKELLEKGNAVVIYPEGRLSIDGSLQELLPGTASLAMKTGVPICPVIQIGSNKLLPYGGKRLHRADIEVRFGKPFCVKAPENGSGAERKAALAEADAKLRQEMLALY